MSLAARISGYEGSDHWQEIVIPCREASNSTSLAQSPVIICKLHLEIAIYGWCPGCLPGATVEQRTQ